MNAPTRNSADNFKRLLLLLAPDALPFLRGSAAVERAWLRFTEWAADDSAVNQDAACSLSLAEALVRVARLGVAAHASSLISHFVAANGEISGPRGTAAELYPPSRVRAP